jgi:WD40 repeat protein
MIKSPFKFLDSYTLADRNVFFGRDQEITELYRKVFESKILLVYGVSGTGKSSLINCGLASRFDDSDWLPVNVRRGNNIIDSLNNSFNKQVTKPYSKNLSVSEKLQSIYLDHFKPIYLIFDQFEELFIFGSAEEKTGFKKLLKEVVESETQCRVIFIIREEFLAGITEFENDLPDIFSNRFRIEKMKRANAISAVEGPCKIHNIKMETGFSEELVGKLCSSANEIELAYLQIYLDRIFRISLTEQNKEEDVEFSKEILTRAGSVSDLLGQFLDEQIGVMEDPNTATSILKSFVSLQGTKRHMNETEILDSIKAFGTLIPMPELLRYLTKLVDLRILRERDETGHFELRHDSLASKIYEKFTALEKDIIEVEQFIENTYSTYEKRGKLLTADDLEYIALYESRLHLSKDIWGFIDKSKAVLKSAKRKRTNIAIATAITLLIILSVFTIWAIRERSVAQDQRNKALAEKYNFLARDLAAVDPTKALRLAEYAHSLDTANFNISNNVEKIYYENNMYSVLSRHNYYANSVIFFHDGMRLLIGTSDKTVKILDLDGNETQVLKQTSAIESVALSLDERMILTGSDDNIARLYDIKGNLIQLFKGHSGTINSVAFSSDGQKMLTGSDDFTARLWDINGNVLQIFAGHTDIVKSAIFSPDNKIIATGSFDNTARIWDQCGKLIKVLKGSSSAVGVLKFSPDGMKVLAACEEHAALLWDLNGNLIQQFIGHQCSISTIDISPDGQKILTASCDNTCRLWDIQGNILQVFKGHTGWIPSAIFSPDGQKFVSASSDNTVRLWDLKGNSMQTFKGSKSEILSVAFSPDGKKILTGSFDNTAKLWDLKGNLIHIFEGHFGPVFCVAFSPDGNRILTGSDDQTARLWNIKGEVMKIMTGHTATIKSCCFSPDGRTIITGSNDYTLRFWDQDGNEIKVYNLTATIKSVAFSPDGQKILIGSGDHTARLWDLDGNLIQLFKAESDPVISVAFSPDGRKILTGSYGLTAHLYDTKGNILTVFKGHTTNISSVAFSPDGQRIVTVSAGDNSARLWNLRGDVIQYFRGHTSGITSVKFSPDGQELLTGSYDNTARLWSVKMTYHEFNSGNNYDVFGISDRIKYNIISYSQVLKSENESELSEAADYYFQEFRQSIVPDKSRYLSYANLLYQKLAAKHADNIKYLLNLLNSYYYMNESETSYRIINEIKRTNEKTRLFSSVDDLLLSIACKTELYRLKADTMLYDNIIESNKKLLSSNQTDDLIRINNFYSDQCHNLDSIGLQLKFPEAMIITSQVLINNKLTNVSLLKSISEENSDLSMKLITMKDFKLSLKAALLSLQADSSNEYIYTNLPLAYIFNNKYNEAKKIYLKFIDLILKSENKPYNKIFLQDIETLENQGIMHPDFNNVKELLKK